MSYKFLIPRYKEMISSKYALVQKSNLSVSRSFDCIVTSWGHKWYRIHQKYINPLEYASIWSPEKVNRSNFVSNHLSYPYTHTLTINLLYTYITTQTNRFFVWNRKYLLLLLLSNQPTARIIFHHDNHKPNTVSCRIVP